MQHIFRRVKNIKGIQKKRLYLKSIYTQLTPTNKNQFKKLFLEKFFNERDFSISISVAPFPIKNRFKIVTQHIKHQRNPCEYKLPGVGMFCITTSCKKQIKLISPSGNVLHFSLLSHKLIKQVKVSKSQTLFYLYLEYGSGFYGDLQKALSDAQNKRFPPILEKFKHKIKGFPVAKLSYLATSKKYVLNPYKVTNQVDIFSEKQYSIADNLLHVHTTLHKKELCVDLKRLLIFIKNNRDQLYEVDVQTLLRVISTKHKHYIIQYVRDRSLQKIKLISVVKN